LSRPKLRGMNHLVMSPLALVAGLVLITITTELRGRITLTIFTLTAVSLFTCSAIYHRIPWGPSAKAIWRRIDHANIPLLIAGTYTPFAIYLLDKSQAVILLSLVWGGALLSGVFRVFWLGAPRWLYVPIYLALGWAALIYLPDFYRNGGLIVFLLVAFGGILYSLGALIYAVKWPNFSINWFGFHELFHAMTAAAFISHFIAAILVIVG
ncbi:MAG: PAQR family membrane homeostasis protein TrhA, partial [Candidatus Nanopelagicaceae bacterium]